VSFKHRIPLLEKRSTEALQSQNQCPPDRVIAHVVFQKRHGISLNFLQFAMETPKYRSESCNLVSSPMSCSRPGISQIRQLRAPAR